jgi:hypothetical protein
MLIVRETVVFTISAVPVVVIWVGALQMRTNGYRIGADRRCCIGCEEPVLARRR